jgi:DNA-binding beta-propeller fold protein YncE
MIRTVLGLGLLALAASCASGGPGGPDPAGGAPAEGSALVYVANEASGVVSVVDPADRSVQVVDLKAMGYGDNPKPHHVVVEPDGSAWYVTLIGANRVLKFDRSNRLVDSATTEGADGALYVGRSMNAVNPPARIARIERATMEGEEIEVFVPQPHAMAADPSGRWVFTGSMHENTLVRVDPASGRAEITRLEGDHGMPHALVHYAVSPDGRTLVATAEHTGKLLVFDVASPPEMRLVKEIDVGSRPWHPAFSPDGRFVWFGVLGEDQVTVVDASTWTVADVIRGEGLAQPHGLAISPDGSRVYVSSRNQDGRYVGKGRFGAAPGTLTVIDADTRRVVDLIELPPYGAGMGVAGGR